MKRPSARVGVDGVMPEISRSARGADTRNRILHSARDVLAEYGMEGFTNRRVSARAQISHGMFHYHFRDKSDFVRALVEHARDDWITPLETMVKAPSTAESRARAVIDWMAEPATEGVAVSTSNWWGRRSLLRPMASCISSRSIGAGYQGGADGSSRKNRGDRYGRSVIPGKTKEIGQRGTGLDAREQPISLSHRRDAVPAA
jgi:AcrR family transcriptional regulator